MSTSNIFLQYSFVSLGANLNSRFGSPADSIRHAIALLEEFSRGPLLVSSLLETAPLDCPPGSPLFINGVVGLIPEEKETAFTLLKRLQLIENSVGRTRSGLVNEARVLDLDLITFKSEMIASTELTVPHPRALERLFVLEPLRELTGNIAFPGQSKLIDEIISEIKA